MRSSKRGHTTTRLATALIVAALAVGSSAAAGGAVPSAAAKISEAKLRTLDYTDGLLSTGTLANLDPQVIAAQASPGAIIATFDPQVCKKSLGGLPKGIVTGASTTYDGSTTQAFTAAFSFASEKEAKAYLDSVDDRVDLCTDFTIDTTAFTLDIPKLPKTGDQLATFRASGVLGGYNMHVVQLFERRGQFVNYLSFITPEDLTDAALAGVTNEQKKQLADLMEQLKPQKKR